MGAGGRRGRAGTPLTSPLDRAIKLLGINVAKVDTSHNRKGPRFSLVTVWEYVLSARDRNNNKMRKTTGRGAGREGRGGNHL